MRFSFCLTRALPSGPLRRLESFFTTPGVRIFSCTFLVQFGVKPVFVGGFGNRDGLFHMVFNRTVENCHRPFTFLSARDALWLPHCRTEYTRSGVLILRRLGFPGRAGRAR
jgi:hypothetical protein